MCSFGFQLDWILCQSFCMRRRQEVEEAPGRRLLSLTWGHFQCLLSLTISRELAAQKRHCWSYSWEKLTRVGRREWPVLYVTSTWVLKWACNRIILCFHLFFLDELVWPSLYYPLYWHPPIHLPSALTCVWNGAVLKATPSYRRARAGYTLDELPVHLWAT